MTNTLPALTVTHEEALRVTPVTILDYALPEALSIIRAVRAEEAEWIRSALVAFEADEYENEALQAREGAFIAAAWPQDTAEAYWRNADRLHQQASALHAAVRKALIGAVLN